MRWLEHRIPPPVVMVITGLLMWLAARPVAWPSRESLPLLLAALVAVLLGLVFCLAGVVAFRRARTTVNPLAPEKASALVTDGIYRVSRNPMYVGFACFLVAWSLVLATPWALLGVAGFVAYITRFQVLPEERALAKLFGSAFSDWQARVRRWL